MNCVGFPAVARADAHILVLGSLPGAESLRRRQYYANTGNSFWKIMASLTATQPTAPYEERLEALLSHKIALWDVCRSAVRVGSLDASIQNSTVAVNDFDTFLRAHPKIKLVGFNGQYAEKLFLRRVSISCLRQTDVPITCAVLPSTSAAHAAKSVETKTRIWSDVIEPFM